MIHILNSDNPLILLKDVAVETLSHSYSVGNQLYFATAKGDVLSAFSVGPSFLEKIEKEGRIQVCNMTNERLNTPIYVAHM